MCFTTRCATTITATNSGFGALRHHFWGATPRGSWIQPRGAHPASITFAFAPNTL
jgi:hypothetical protein